MTRDELTQAMHDAHPGALHDAICDYLIKTTRDGMYDNAHDTGWDDVQEELRKRFELPAWNVMHECADMIGDTDGLS